MDLRTSLAVQGAAYRSAENYASECASINGSVEYYEKIADMYLDMLKAALHDDQPYHDEVCYFRSCFANTIISDFKP